MIFRSASISPSSPIENGPLTVRPVFGPLNSDASRMVPDWPRRSFSMPEPTRPTPFSIVTSVWPDSGGSFRPSTRDGSIDQVVEAGRDVEVLRRSGADGAWKSPTVPSGVPSARLAATLSPSSETAPAAAAAQRTLARMMSQSGSARPLPGVSIVAGPSSSATKRNGS